MTNTICDCGRPIHDQAYVCGNCSDQLARWLGDVTAVSEAIDPQRYPSDHPDERLRGRIVFGRGTSTRWDIPASERGNLPRELDAARYRQTTTGRNGGKATETPVPWDQRAREATYVLQGAVTSWARIVEEERGADLPDDCTVAGLAAWLLNHVDWIRHHPAGAEACDEITTAVRNAQHVVDIRPERWYAGPCDDCGADLYGKAGAAQVVCPGDECGRVYDVAERRAELLEAARDRLAGASLIARAVTSLGQPVTPERIRQWATRGRIVAHSVDLRGRALYRVGDVLDLVADDAAGTRRGRQSA